MKRLLFIALLGLSLMPELAHAQRRKRQAPLKLGATFGVKLGASFSNLAGYEAISGAPPREYEGRFGIMGGLLANYRFTPQLSAQIEGLYATRGTDLFTGTGGSRREYNAKLTYVDIPVLAKFNAKIFYVEAGIVPSVLVSGKLEEASSKKSEDITGLETLDVGYGIGVGIETPPGGIFGVRYVRGVGALGQGGTLIGPYTLENSSVQITGGYIFNHSTKRGRRH